MILLEKTSFNSLGTVKRLLYYSYFIQNEKYDFQKEWEKIIERLNYNDENDWDKIGEGIDYSILVELEDYHIIEDEDVKLTRNLSNKLILLFQKEGEWEKNANDYLRSVAKAHPIVAKLIIVFLSSILFGLIEDILYDAINPNTDKAIVHYEKLYIDQDNQIREVYFDDNGFFRLEDINEYTIKENNDF